MTTIVLDEDINLESFVVDESSDMQATHVIPYGEAANTERTRTVQYVRWKVTAVDAGNRLLTLADPNANAEVKPIQFDDCFNGWIVERSKTGRKFVVEDTIKATQQIKLTAFPVAAGLAWATGESLRLMEHANVQSVWYANAPTGAAGELLRITSTPSANAFTVANIIGGGSTLVTDHLRRDRKLRGYTLQLAATATNNDKANRLVTTASTASIAVGDIGFETTSGAEPWSLSPSAVFEVESITSGTQFKVKQLFGDPVGNPLIQDGVLTATNLRIYRPRANFTYVASEIASTDTITVEDATGAALAQNDLVLMWSEFGGAGAVMLPCNPATRVLYGNNDDKVGRILRSELGGEDNWIHEHDPWFRTAVWTLIAGGTAATLVDIATVGGKYGTKCMQVVTGTTVESPAFLLPVPANATEVVLRVRVKVPPAWSGTQHVMFDMLTALGQTVATQPRKRIAVRPVGGTGGSSAGFFVQVAAGVEWVEFDAVILLVGGGVPPNDDYQAHVALHHTMQLNNQAGSNVYVDAWQITPDATPPIEEPNVSKTFWEFGRGQELWGKVCEYHDTVDTPPRQFEVQVRDLYRADPVEYSTKRIDVGTTFAYFVPWAGAVENLVCTAKEPNLEDYEDTVVHLETSKVALTRQVADAFEAAA